jgi:hypothetical protein
MDEIKELDRRSIIIPLTHIFMGLWQLNEDESEIERQIKSYLDLWNPCHPYEEINYDDIIEVITCMIQSSDSKHFAFFEGELKMRRLAIDDRQDMITALSFLFRGLLNLNEHDSAIDARMAPHKRSWNQLHPDQEITYDDLTDELSRMSEPD